MTARKITATAVKVPAPGELGGPWFAPPATDIVPAVIPPPDSTTDMVDVADLRFGVGPASYCREADAQAYLARAEGHLDHATAADRAGDTVRSETHLLLAQTSALLAHRAAQHLTGAAEAGGA